MFLIGIAGGIASGKSLIARCFQHFGAVILDADGIGHEVLRIPEVVDKAEAAWGKSIIDENREIIRSSLGKIVFDPVNGPVELGKLEAITHPIITERIRDCLRTIESTDPDAVVVVDAPVMFKAGWDQWCDRIVFVDAPIELRRKRAASRGWDSDELDRREQRQIPLDEKRRKSTDLIDNSGSREATYLQSQQLWKKWKLTLPKDLDSPISLFD